MKTLVRCLCLAALPAAPALGQRTFDPAAPAAGRVLPVTAPVVELEGTLDLATGRFRRARVRTVGDDGEQEVYDNTCASGGYLGLLPAGPGGTGSAHAQTLGDYGAIPGDTFPGDASCTIGCAASYDITRFEIAWCQLDAPTTGSTIVLEFWDAPQTSCQLGTAPGNNPTGGTRPPAMPTVFATTLTGLPRNNVAGTLACYVLSVQLATPGFPLAGSTSFATGAVAGDKFAWGFTMPTSTGADGPMLAGDVGTGAVCSPCAGSIWEASGQTTNAGTGAGQDGTFFLESYGGSVTPSSTDCFAPGAGGSPSGMHLQLFAHEPCVPDACACTNFCDGADLSLAACPCANPGDASTGCDTPIPAMQGGGTTGGVLLVRVAQQNSPVNRATLRATGFPTGSTPGGVVIRNTRIDPFSPIVFGDGLLCVDITASPGTFARIGASTAANGVMECTFGHGTMTGVGNFFYQLWFRSTPTSYCDPSAAFNLSSGVLMTW